MLIRAEVETPQHSQPIIALFRRRHVDRAKHLVRIRSRISRAARSVNVIATTWLRSAGASPPTPGSSSLRYRSVSTNVLPQPAPAESATATRRALMARSCSSVRGFTPAFIEFGWRRLP